MSDTNTSSTGNGKPPKVPKKSTSAGSASSKSQMGSSNSSETSKRSINSNAPSASATNENGFKELNERLRSIFADWLGLPLLFAFHGLDLPAICMELVGGRENDTGTRRDVNVNAIFKEAVTGWLISRQGQNPKQWERLLTTKLSDYINISAKGLGFYSYPETILTDGVGRVDIVLSTSEEDTGNNTTPLAVIEFGLHSKEWWKKLDQNVKYVKYMCAASNKNNLLVFEKPLLFVVITFDDKLDSEMKIGVFLCSPRERSGSAKKDFRLSLLWRSKTKGLENASKNFGKLLRVTSDFKIWRERPRPALWEYFGSNCCRFGDMVSERFYLVGTSIIVNSDSGFFC